MKARPKRRRSPEPLLLDGVATYPLSRRKSKVSLGDFARPCPRGARIGAFLQRLPRILAGETLRRLAGEIARARARRKPILWGIGAHVLKVGLSPVLVDLMEKGFVTGLALNGAGIVHDFELAVAGQTSEDVEAGLGQGAFGMARETGEEINAAIAAGDRDGLGLGAAVGRYLAGRRPRHLQVSLLAAAHRLDLPATVHVAVGTDIVHMHPSCDPAALGRATHLDFRLFAAQVARLGGGGVYLNVGSAVLLPEVFLKAVTLARNLGHPAPRLRHREPGLPPVVPAEHERGRAAHARGGPRLQPHRPPRAAGPAPGRGPRGGLRPTTMTAPIRADLSGRVCLVTGATAGIGRAAALGLAGLGAHVVLGGPERGEGGGRRGARSWRRPGTPRWR